MYGPSYKIQMTLDEEIKRNRQTLAYRYAFRAGFRPVKQVEVPDQNDPKVTRHETHMKRGNETVRLYRNSIDGKGHGYGGASYHPGGDGKDQHFGFGVSRLIASPFLKLGGIGDFRLLMHSLGKGAI